MRADYDDLLSRLRAVPAEIVIGIARKGRVGRDRAIARLDRLIGQPSFMDAPHAVVWRVLYPRLDPLADVRPRQGVEVMAVCLGNSRGRPDIDATSFNLFVSEHALGRLLTRARSMVDIAATILEAHDALLAAPAEIFQTIADQAEREWALPSDSAGGAFLARVRVVRINKAGKDTIVLFSADTWIDESQLHEFQVAQIAAIRWRGDGPKMIDGIMLPRFLRPEVKTVDGVAELPMNVRRGRSVRHGIQQRQALRGSL